MPAPKVAFSIPNSRAGNCHYDDIQGNKLATRLLGGREFSRMLAAPRLDGFTSRLVRSGRWNQNLQRDRLLNNAV